MEMVEEHIKGILKNRKIHFTLIDPDEQTPQEALKIAEEAILGGTDGIMIGGSTVNNDEVDETCKILSENIEVPIILFPGNINSVSKYADAIYELFKFYQSLLDLWCSGISCTNCKASWN